MVLELQLIVLAAVLGYLLAWWENRKHAED